VTSSEPVVSINGLTKHYRIYPSPADRLRDALGWRARFKEFAALDGVTLSIAKGEFLGIVGKNGSGKSTLLKVVAGQLEPTSGTVVCRGRVALLQLGLGFDPELTGLDNIKQARLLQHLKSDYEEIVQFVRDFSEIGDFINYPVKTYSSGMYSRLAFATAVAGDPDILIADEVLAVGDMSFSQKCLAKMREFKEKGKTVILVTHDVNAVKSFCDRAAWLNDGKLVAYGKAQLVAEDFRNFMLYGVTSDLSSVAVPPATGDAPAVADGAETAPPEVAAAQPMWIVPNTDRRTVSLGKVKIHKYRFLDADFSTPITKWIAGRPIVFEIVFEIIESTSIHSFGFTLNDRHGMIAVHLNSEFGPAGLFSGTKGQIMTARFRFDVPMLARGDYTVSIGCAEGDEGVMAEKYDFDTTIEINHSENPQIDHQGGYVIIPTFTFEYSHHA